VTPQLAQMLQVMLQLRGLRQDAEQFQQRQGLEQKKFDAEDNERNLSSAQKFITFMKSLQPEARQAWIDMASQSAHVNPESARTISHQLSTDPATVLAAAVERGAGSVDPAQVASMAMTGRGTGENAASQHQAEFFDTGGFGRQSLMDQYNAQTFGRQSSGQLAVDSQVPRLPENQLQNAARIALQIGLSPQQVAQNLIAHQQVAVAQQNADIQGFEANTARQSVLDASDRSEKELNMRGQGLFSGGAGANGALMQARTFEDQLKAYGLLKDVYGQLNSPLLPQGNQDMLKLMAGHISPAIGLDSTKFMQYLQQSHSPGWWAAAFRGGR
jgi:hypothetical protein